MKTKQWILLSALMLTMMAACQKANFGTQTGRRGGSGIVAAQTNPNGEPETALDVSKLPKNSTTKGPQAGNGQVLDKSIDLTCDTAAGATVEISEAGSSTPVAGLTGLQLLGTDVSKGAPVVQVDKDGNTIGGGTPTGTGIDEGFLPLPDQPQVIVPQEGHITARVRGQFCPTSQNRLTVLFVVDHSGSMGQHVPQVGQPQVPGNDPQINGSCGRLRAAQAVVSKFGPNDQVQIGMVPFAGGILTSKVQQIIPIEQFRTLLNKDVFCQYVVQNPSFGYDPINAGGVNGANWGLDSSTNYRAAFNAAQSLLQPVYGRKVVYFISDGEPTSGGADPVAAGMAAGNQLRATVNNLELNALLLGPVDVQAQRVLELVAGSPARVALADNANALATQIMSFPDAVINESTGNAWLTVAPYQPKEQLGLNFLRRDATLTNVWNYETKPFVLLGVPGQEVVNLVEITAQGQDGTTHSAVVRIRYRQ